MTMDELARAMGFAGAAEFHRLVAATDITTQDKLAAFRSWQENDGSKAGLLALRGPVSDPSETLALIAEHRLTLVPQTGGLWLALPAGTATVRDSFTIERDEWDACAGGGSTIGDAVRECVQRIREGDRV